MLLARSQSTLTRSGPYSSMTSTTSFGRNSTPSIYSSSMGKSSNSSRSSLSIYSTRSRSKPIPSFPSHSSPPLSIASCMMAMFSSVVATMRCPRKRISRIGFQIGEKSIVLLHPVAFHLLLRLVSVEAVLGDRFVRCVSDTGDCRPNRTISACVSRLGWYAMLAPTLLPPMISYRRVIVGAVYLVAGPYPCSGLSGIVLSSRGTWAGDDSPLKSNQGTDGYATSPALGLPNRLGCPLVRPGW